MALRIATWNINSVRLRLENLRRLIAAAAPDIICLQETKVEDKDFPRAAVAEMGYPHLQIRGMKSYNGVAILSRNPFAEAGTRDWCGRQDSRHAFVGLPGGIEIHNFYVPAGGNIPDPEQNDKFAHKLSFLDDMAGWFEARRKEPNRFILTGDLNIAPLETDVWSHKQLLNVVSHTPVEVASLGRLGASHDWVDAVRHFHPPGGTAVLMVELSRPRLGSQRPRTAARSHMGDAGAQRAPRGRLCAKGGPRLGASLGPRAGDRQLERRRPAVNDGNLIRWIWRPGVYPH